MIAVEEPKSPAEESVPRSAPRAAADLAVSTGYVSPANTNKEVILFFKDHPDQASLPVVEDGVPIGIINRGIFLTGFSMPFHREVYERKSCIAFMDKTPLIVDGELPVSELGKLAVDAGAKVLQDGFMVTRKGQFSGLGTGLDLLRALGELEAERNRVIHESIAYAQIIQGALLATSLEALKANVHFHQHNLLQPFDPGWGHFDLVFCRNVFIYLSMDAAQAALGQLEAVGPGQQRDADGCSSHLERHAGDDAHHQALGYSRAPLVLGKVTLDERGGNRADHSHGQAG